MGLPVTTTTLLSGLLARDQAAWSRLSRLYGGYLAWITRARLARHGSFDAADVDDVVQETFLAVLKASHGYDAKRARLRSFIRGIHDRKIVDHLRIRLPLSGGTLADVVCEPDAGDDAAAARALRRGLLCEALHELRDSAIRAASKRIFVRVKLRGWRAGDAAIALGVPPEVAYRRLYVCLDFLKRRLDALRAEFEVQR